MARSEPLTVRVLIVFACKWVHCVSIENIVMHVTLSLYLHLTLHLLSNVTSDNIQLAAVTFT